MSKTQPKSYADGVPLSDRAVAALELQQLANVLNLSLCARNALLRVSRLKAATMDELNEAVTASHP